MRTLRTVAELRTALTERRRRGMRIGLVPTMGALHAGHLSLIEQARASCDVVVMSLFVNPTQFNEGADLANYPRDEQRDATLAADAGADYLFAPDVAEVYPEGFSTTVVVAGPTAILEGEQRGRAHFDGVTTVVTKLLNMVVPDVAYFGQKDAQQAFVISKLVRDLNMAVEIAVCPTVREPDGLALSSRNVHLDSAERDRATALNRTLAAAAGRVANGERDPAVVIDAALAELAAAGVETEYFALVTPDDFAVVTHITGPVLAVVAARLGSTRLIDNRLLEPVPALVADPLT